MKTLFLILSLPIIFYVGVMFGNLIAKQIIERASK